MFSLILALAVVGTSVNTSATAPQPPPSAVAPAMQDPGPSSEPYRVHAGDQLQVDVFGDASMSHVVTVLSGGDIFYPLVGRIHVDGMTPDQAAVAIGAALRKYLRQPMVTVSVLSQGPIDVLVLGDVKNPGKYLMPATSRVSDALAVAGGLANTDGDYPVARVETLAGAISQVPLQKLLHDGDTSVDMRLNNGSTLYIPAPQTFTVEVLGSVDKPGEITLREGDKIAIAIAKAGVSPATNPDLNNVEVKRTMPDGTSKTYYINVYATLKEGNASGDLTMAKGDVVYVPQAKKPVGNGLLGVFTTLLLLVK